MTEKSTELMVPDNKRLIAAFAEPKKVDDILAAIKKEVKSFVPDLTTAKSRKEITSLAFKVTRSKTAFDEVGKKINEEGRKQLNAVDAERRKIRETLDELAKDVKKPLVSWQAKENLRITDLKARLEEFDISRITAFIDSETLQGHLERITAIETGDDWEEFKVAAKANKSAAIVTLKGYILTAKEREDNQRELEELRAEKILRDQKDRERKEAEAAETERKRYEAAEKKRKADQVKAQKAAAEKARKDAEAKAKSAAADAKAKALADADAAEAKHKRELAEAKQREEQAAQNERDRQAREEQRKKDAEEKRASNTRRRNKVKKEIVAAIEEVLMAAGPSTGADFDADIIQSALFDGKIPHVKVEF